ncbi:MAG: LysM peptidoglycan-binding domain-containing protein [Sulfuritalea sp.]|nr:LysM peptidoglycan-binding domain-containing protein [Sulfuritalea sp.]MDP1982975.1 LysM peptidoglycan-binding domain-containing protein [Sulfuritalea sp.]
MLAYDAAGNRRTAIKKESDVAVSESYSYDANNRLVSTARDGSTTSLRSYDLAGKVTEQSSFSSPGTLSERRTSAYDANSRLTEQNVYNGANTHTQRTLYTAYDGVGNNTGYQVQILTGTAYTNTYATTYAKFDSYKESQVAGSSTWFQAGTTTSSYDRNGNLTAVSETFATSKNRGFVTDQAGHILRKTENGKTQNYFYAGDKPLGSSGALTGADFDFNYTPVSEQYPASTPGSYVVSAGDTLRGIALAVFGDAQLWYLIADANGLKTDADLTAGRNLTIPNKVTNLRNAADTYKPYAPGAIIGDTRPTLPDPPPPPVYSSSGGGGGCGGFGAILVAVIAVVAVVMTAGALAAPMAGVTGRTFSVGMSALGAGISGAGIAGAGAAGGLGFAGFAIAGAVGSIASQAVGMAIGVQEEFSWGAVAMGALSSVAGGAAGKIVGTSFGPAGGFGNMVARAVVGSVITQGVGVAVGLQKEFSWSGVAAAGVSAGVGQAVGSSTVFGDNTFARDLTARLASGAARQVVSGGKANWANVAADAFGNAIANSLGYRATAVGNAQQGAALEGATARATMGSVPPMGSTKTAQPINEFLSDDPEGTGWVPPELRGRNDLNFYRQRDMGYGQTEVTLDDGETGAPTIPGKTWTGDSKLQMIGGDARVQLTYVDNASVLEQSILTGANGFGGDPLRRNDGIYQDNNVWSYPVSLNDGVEVAATPEPAMTPREIAAFDAQNGWNWQWNAGGQSALGLWDTQQRMNYHKANVAARDAALPKIAQARATNNVNAAYEAARQASQQRIENRFATQQTLSKGGYKFSVAVDQSG